jgi:hypothetical protein
MTLVPRPKVEETLETINQDELFLIARNGHHMVTLVIPGIEFDVVLSQHSFLHTIKRIINTSDMPKYAVINRNVKGMDTVIRILFIGSAVECSHYCSGLEKE